MLPRLLCGLLVLLPLLLLQLNRSGAPEHSISTASVDGSSAASAGFDAGADAEQEATAEPGWARAELDQILLAEAENPTVTVASRTAKARPRASRSKPRTTSTTVKKKTSTTAKPAAKGGKTTTTAPKKSSSASAAPPAGRTQSGIASWYEAAPSGTCAHRTLPKGTRFDVTNLSNGKRTQCVVADRGPYVDGFIIDLSKSNFSELAPLDDGIIKVTITW
jgi:rare lipoprotein A